MAKLIYSAITSVDGYAADVDGNFEWAVPDEEVHLATDDVWAVCKYTAHGEYLSIGVSRCMVLPVLGRGNGARHPTSTNRYAKNCI